MSADRRLQAVLFDLDDTLYAERDYVASGFRAVAEHLARRCGVDADAAAARLLALLDRDGRGRLFDTLLAELGLDEPVETLLFVYRGHRPALELPAASRRTLAELRRRGLKLGLVTDGMGAMQRRKIAALGVEPLVDAVVVSDELGAAKPDAAPYRVALDLLAVEPAAAAYVGDDPAKDFRWPNAAGMLSVQVTAAGRDDSALEPAARAQHRIGEVGELPALLDRLTAPTEVAVERRERTDPPRRVVRDPRHGHRRFDPPPSREEIDELYRERYERQVRDGVSAPDLRRLLEGGAEARAERDWLKRTLHADVANLVTRHAPGRRVVDLGCGTGDLLAHLAADGFEVVGIEPSPLAEVARERGLSVVRGSLEDQPSPERGHDAAVMLNVLEHVVDPVAALATVHRLLVPRGVLVVRVPNDFSPLQEAARQELGGAPWWLAWPDHQSYFDFASLRSLVEAEGFDWLEAMGDFPMELFLLMGEDYTTDPEVGAACHRKRRRFELALPAAPRRDLYRALGAAGMGRNCLVALRRREGAA